MLLAPFMSMPAFCRVLFTCSCFAGSTCQSATLMHTHLTGNHKHSRAVAVPWLVARARLWFPTACLRSLACRRAFSSDVCVCSDVTAVVRVMRVRAAELELRRPYVARSSCAWRSPFCKRSAATRAAPSGTHSQRACESLMGEGVAFY